MPADVVPLEISVPWLRLWWWTLVAALLVALDQVDRLFTSVLSSDGTSWGLGQMMGATALLARDGWHTAFGWSTFRGQCLALYLVLDAVLIVVYLVGGVVHLLRHFEAGAFAWRFVLLLLLVLADVTEDVLAAVASSQTTVTGSIAKALPAVSTAKFALGAVLVVVLLWSWRDRVQAAYGGVERRFVAAAGVAPVTWRRATWFVARQHRLSLVPVVLLGVLLLAPGTGILDQMPDVERRWADGRGNFWAEGALGLVALCVLTGVLFVLGRARTALACRDLADAASDVLPGPPPATEPPQPEPERRRHHGRVRRAAQWLRRDWSPDDDARGRLRNPEGRSSLRDLAFWLIGPVVVGLAVAGLASAGAPVSPWRYLVFCAIPVVVVASSLVLRHHRGPWKRPARQRWTDRELHRLGALGDSLALSVLALGAVGAVRALTPVAVLGLVAEPADEPFAAPVLVAGLLGVLMLWPAVGLAYAVGRDEEGGTSRFARLWAWLTPRKGESQPQLVRGRLPVVMLVVSSLVFVALGLVPSLAAQLGVLFVLVIGLTALTGITAGAGLVAAQRPTAEVFRALRLRSTPVASLLLVAVVAAGLVDGGNVLHGVRSATDPRAAAVAEARPRLADAIKTWADDRVGAGCAQRRTVDGQPVDVLPMALLASEGGGIRAAYWTAAVAEQLDTGCAQGAVALSSGVSGGAVGLAVSRYDDHPLAAVGAISNSRALSNALVGLQVRDFAFSATGVPLPAIGQPVGSAFTDRAALMEQAWAADASTGTDPTTWADASFADPRAVRSDRVGSVILNSMAVGNACRVWVSEVRLREDGDAAGADRTGGARCDADDESGVRSIDLLSTWSDEQGPSGEAAVGVANPASCLHGLRVVTAALLAARFPYVTPSGRVGPCPRTSGTVAPTDQLVDGGYLENTGLGTLVDLSEVWVPAVQQWNADHVVSATRPVRQLIVPVVVYLDNDSGTDRSAPRKQLANETLLPPLARLRAYGSADDATLQRAVDVVQPGVVCGSDDAVCRDALGAGHRAFVVFPATEPQVAAPLGWILSDASRDALRAGVEEQRKTRCPTLSELADGKALPAGCRRGYGSLDDLIVLAGGPPG